MITQDLCIGDDEYFKCDPSPKTNYTVFINEAFYGIKASPLTTPGCKFT